MGSLVQVSIPLLTGLAEDVITNTFAIGGLSSSSSAADIDAVEDAVRFLYVNTYDGGAVHSVGSNMNGTVSRAALAAGIDIYDISAALDGSPHGSPFHSSSWTVPTQTGTGSLPNQVAIAITLEAHGRAAALVETADGVDAGIERDRPRQRRTGRVFTGPWNNEIVAVDANNNQRPSVSKLTQILAEWASVMEDLSTNTSGRCWFGVWSRVDESIRSIDSISADDRFDTMRSRLSPHTTRVRDAVAVTINTELAA